MPPKPTKLATPVSDGSENAEFLACFIRKLQRSTKEKRRKQREEIEASYAQELERVRAGAIIAMDAAEKEALRRKRDILERLAQAVARRGEVEAALVREMTALEEGVTGRFEEVVEAMDEVISLGEAVVN